MSAGAADIALHLRRRPMVAITAAILALFVTASLAADLVAPQDAFDLANLDLMNALLPPVWLEGGSSSFLLGTDDQGRDILSTILHGARISLLVAALAVAASVVLGVAIGLLSGLVGGAADAVIMRIADIQLSFPAILLALLIDGIARAALPAASHEAMVVPVLVLAIALSGWVPYARTVRGATRVERTKDYVEAAHVIGVSPVRIALAHVLPNVLGPVLVLATVQIATAIVTEATLSFLGVGMPPTTPSLGTLIRVGSEFLFSGMWWIAVFPGLALVVVTVGANILGDFLRDVLNPRLAT